MLGKGLESLIPPASGSDGNGQQPDDAGAPPFDGGEFEAVHPHLAPIDGGDSGPQVLSFDFGGGSDGEPAEPQSGFSGKSGVAKEAPPAAANPPTGRPGVLSGKPAAPPTPPANNTGSEAKPSDYVFHIEVSKIKPNPNQPRRNFGEEGIWELARSIREFGFLQPLVVSRKEVETAHGVDVEYELIAGERRLLAAKKLGLEYVPAIIRDVDLEREKLELAVIENIQREDLNPLERARAFQRLQEEFRMTQREIAAKLGKSRETVANTVRLLDLPAYIQEALNSGSLSESHGRFLLAINDPAAQKKLFDDIVLRGMTTREVKRRVEAAKPRREHGGSELPPELKMLEERLTAELGAPVKIERGADTGKIVITFYSDEELRHIMERLGGEVIE